MSGLTDREYKEKLDDHARRLSENYKDCHGGVDEPLTPSEIKEIISDIESLLRREVK